MRARWTADKAVLVDEWPRGKQWVVLPRDPQCFSLSVLLHLPNQKSKKLRRNRLLDAGCLTNFPRFQRERPDHMRGARSIRPKISGLRFGDFLVSIESRRVQKVSFRSIAKRVSRLFNMENVESLLVLELDDDFDGDILNDIVWTVSCVVISPV